MYVANIAATKSRYAVVITRHRTPSRGLVAGAGDGVQDADTVPEPLPAEPATTSTAALRSVGGPERRQLPTQRPRPRPRPSGHNHQTTLGAGSNFNRRKGVQIQPTLTANRFLTAAMTRCRSARPRCVSQHHGSLFQLRQLIARHQYARDFSDPDAEKSWMVDLPSRSGPRK